MTFCHGQYNFSNFPLLFLIHNWITFFFLGLVFFKEGPDNGYGLICGPGGSYDPERGNLEGLCAAVS